MVKVLRGVDLKLLTLAPFSLFCLRPPRLYFPLLHHSLSLPRPLLLLLLARLSLWLLVVAQRDALRLRRRVRFNLFPSSFSSSPALSLFLFGLFTLFLFFA